MARVADTTDWEAPREEQIAGKARTKRVFATIPLLLRLDAELHPYAALVGQSMVMGGHAIYSLQDAWKLCPWLTQGQVRYGLGVLVDHGLLERTQDHGRTVIYYLLGWDVADDPENLDFPSGLPKGQAILNDALEAQS